MARRPPPPGPKARWQTARPDLWRRLSRESGRMRLTPTPAEALLWERLRNRALGVRFRRQHAMGRFIVDFCCIEAGLVVEADGPSHAGRAQPDAERDAHLAERGFRVLRFSNAAVLGDIDAVIDAIRLALGSRTAFEPRDP